MQHKHPVMASCHKASGSAYDLLCICLSYIYIIQLGFGFYLIILHKIQLYTEMQYNFTVIDNIDKTKPVKKHQAIVSD